jgi:AraC-like DNA-binding protein
VKRAGAGPPATVALAAVEGLVRPDGMDGAVELALAAPACRSFPARVTETLGVCLKIGPSHEVRADGRPVEYPADSVCLRPPGCVWSTDDTGPVGFVCIDLAASLLPAEHRRGGMDFVPPAALPDVRALVTLLLSSAPRLEKDEAIATLVSVVYRRGVVLRGTPFDRRGTPAALERARSFLEASLETNPSLDDLAGAAGMNKHVLVRHFRDRFGATPHAYLLLAKVERARTLLARGAAAAEVATVLGFADQAHLTRTFRNVVGLTPAAYRRRVRALG